MLYARLTNYKFFKGLGGFTKRNTVKETRTGKLLNDLTTYLSGFNKSLLGADAAVFVVLDNDDRDPIAFHAELEEVAHNRMITVDHVFCIAIEEMEAWLLGDENALIQAYPNARQSVLRAYTQDSICGTWEVLANAIHKGGLAKLRKENPSYAGIGKIKCEWASNIGQLMDIHQNKSPSFNHFIAELESRIQH